MARAYTFKRKPLTPRNKRRAEAAAKAAEERAKREAEEADKTARHLRLVERRAREAEAFGLEPEQYETLRDMVARAILFGKLEGETVDFGEVSELASAKIASLTGIDAKSFRVTVSDEDVRHARNRHGKKHIFEKRTGSLWSASIGEKNKQQIPLAPRDYLSIPADIQTCKSVTSGTNEKRTGMPTIKIYTQKGQTTRIVVAVVDTTNKSVRFKTMWKRRGKGESMS